MNKKTLVQSIINLAVENGVEDALRFALIEMASKRQKHPYELHYTDGYRSWFFEKNKVVDAFYYGGYLISIYDTKAVGQYNDAENRAKKQNRVQTGADPLFGNGIKGDPDHGKHIAEKIYIIKRMQRTVFANELCGSIFCEGKWGRGPLLALCCL